MPIKKSGLPLSLPIGRLPSGIAQPKTGPVIVTPGRKATAGVIGQRMQPVPKGNGGNGNGGKSGGEKK
ncbi:hypothetical protein [Paraburkholderia fungorum]|uniref:hypothetical protein n=1 Tax=Paraburkholderia fungorum TaxID=134537 RepID=UPI001C1F1D41|nr:hypothetical protein [Paraburkholderia fungorum]MBU7435849.1 hypothetical protein [Paraburkholderia fungorum]